MKKYLITALAAVFLSLNISDICAKVFLLNKMERELPISARLTGGKVEKIVARPGETIEINPLAETIYPGKFLVVLRTGLDVGWGLQIEWESRPFKTIPDAESILITVDKYGTSTISKIE